MNLRTLIVLTLVQVLWINGICANLIVNALFNDTITNMFYGIMC